MSVKLFDSELNVMSVLWEQGALPAKTIAEILGERTGWNKNTTYTVIKKCIEKGAIARSEPHFTCSALVDKAHVQAAEVDELVGKLFGGSTELLVASLVSGKKLPKSSADKLRALIDNMED